MEPRPCTPLRAGVLRLVFDHADASLRYFYVGEQEVLRGISALVRDRAWATIAAEITDVEIRQDSNSFGITFSARCRDDAVDFLWRGTIEGTASSCVIYQFDGEALRDFERNRIGFCVLHPAELQSTACVIEHVDGTLTRANFPDNISPKCPFTNVRAISHADGGVRTAVRMEGDTFEMEDQRNWTDASFKTYCTPGHLPLPVRVPRGAHVSQRVTVTVEKIAGLTARHEASFPWRTPAEVRLDIADAEPQRLPPIGTIWNQCAVSPAVVATLRTMNLSHYRVPLAPPWPEARLRLTAAAEAARKTGSQLEMAFFGSDDFAAELRMVLASWPVELSPSQVARWLVHDINAPATDPERLRSMSEILHRHGQHAPVGGGSCDNFTELNRAPETARAGDFAFFAANPQVHAFDERSLVETLPLHAATAVNAARLAEGRPVAIALSLTRRWRLGETGASPHTPANLQPLQSDPRHASGFAAAWTLGSIAALVKAPVCSATYFELCGDNGLLDPREQPHPVAKPFAQLAPFRDGDTAAMANSHPARVAALALQKRGQRRLLVANLQRAPQRIRLTGAWGRRSLTLDGYAFVSVDIP